MVAVGNTKEVQRILHLPSREWNEDDATLAAQCTAILRTQNGRMVLRPVQAQALVEAAERRGLFAPIRVGGGKTLVSLLLPTVFRSMRPLLLLPAKLVEKTKREWRELLYQWDISRFIRIVSYESLSRVGQVELLDKYQPDLIICDEVHKLKNRKAAVTRRVMRYLNSHPNVPFCAMSGTVTKRSIMDYHHLITHSHKAISPLPHGPLEAQDWADALDNRTIINRPQPGALLTFGGEGDTPLAQARDGFRKRVVRTPAVITLKESRLACSLILSKVRLTPSKEVLSAIDHLDSTWETPDGWPLTDPMAVWRHSRELLMGFYYRWNPRPPKDWLEARRNWGKFVRETLSHSRTLDTELQVARAFPEAPELLAWQAIRKSFEPKTEPVWLSEYVLAYATEWLKERGIVWVEHVAFGNRLAELSGKKFFSQGVDGIELSLGAPVIASIPSNGEGKNLQAWSRNLVVSPPPNGMIMEQLIGRTHREGQNEDEVTVDILVCGTKHDDAIQRMLEDARYIQQSTGQEQKILYADWTE